MLLITTCRKPCTNTRKFARALSACVPSAQPVNRGKKSIEDLIEDARASGLRRIAIIHERKGNPSRIEFIGLDRLSWDWLEPINMKGYVISSPRIAGGRLCRLAVSAAESLHVDGKNKKLLLGLLDAEDDEDAETVLHAGDELIFENKEIILKIHWVV